MRKVYVEVKVKLIVRADEGVNIGDVIDDMDYNFTSQTDGANIEDTTVEDWQITDSK